MQKKRVSIHQAYKVLAGVLLLQLPATLILNPAGMFYTPVSETLGISTTVYAVSMTITMLMMALSTPFVTKVFPGKDVRVCLTACVGIEACCFAANAVAGSVWVFYVTGFFLGIVGNVLIMLVSATMVNRWFSSHVGTCIGLCAAVYGLGGIITNVLGGAVIDGYGWRTAFWTWAGITLIIGLPAALLLVRTDPSEFGLTPYRKAGVSETNLGKPTGISKRAALRTLAFWAVFLGCGLNSGGNALNFYLPSYLMTDLGMSAAGAGSIASIVMVGVLVFSVVIGMVNDRNIAVGTLLCEGLGVVAMGLLGFFGTNPLILCVAAFAFGAPFSPGITVTCAGVVRYLFGSKDFDRIWPYVGMASSGVCAFGSALWGMLIERVGYRPTFLAGGIVFVAVVLLLQTALSRAKDIRSRWTAE